MHRFDRFCCCVTCLSRNSVSAQSLPKCRMLLAQANGRFKTFVKWSVSSTSESLCCKGVWIAAGIIISPTAVLRSSFPAQSIRVQFKLDAAAIIATAILSLACSSNNRYSDLVSRFRAAAVVAVATWSRGSQQQL